MPSMLLGRSLAECCCCLSMAGVAYSDSVSTGCVYSANFIWDIFRVHHASSTALVADSEGACSSCAERSHLKAIAVVMCFVCVRGNNCSGSMWIGSDRHSQSLSGR